MTPNHRTSDQLDAPTGVTANLPESPDAALIEMIAEQSRRVPVPVSVLMLILAAIAYEKVPLHYLVLWLALTFSVLIARGIVLPRLPANTHFSSTQKVRIAVALSGINGLCHGLALSAFPFLTESERSFFSVLLMGLCTGAVGTTAGHRALFLAYLAPVMVPLVIFWGFSTGPGIANPTWVERSISLMIILYIWILVGLAKAAQKTFLESYHLRFREHVMNAQLQSALLQAREASNAKTRFLAAASHDLRQPLQSVSMLIATLSMRQLDERSAHIVTLLERANDALSSLLDSLLDISKLDAGVVHAERKPIALQPLLEQHCERLRDAAKEKGITVHLQVHKAVVASTDIQLLMRIVHNLTDNAIKFTDRGTINVALREKEKRACIVIEDTGRGIPEDQQTNIFNEFYQLDNPERDRSRGLGLGLSIVQRLCSLLDAQLSLQSRVGQGSCFEVSLPLASTSLSEHYDTATASTESGFNIRVLIVDDEQAVRASMRILLEEMGCECAEASSTTEALVQAKQFQPDLLLADFRLRGNDSGISTIQALRQNQPGLNAVLVSGDTAPSRLQEASDAGIRLLHKPVHLNDLRNELLRVHLHPLEA